MKRNPWAPPRNRTPMILDHQWKRARSTWSERVALVEIALLLVVVIAGAGFAVAAWISEDVSNPPRTDMLRVDYTTEPPTVERGYYSDLNGAFYGWFDATSDATVEVDW